MSKGELIRRNKTANVGFVVKDSISYDDNRYTTCTSELIYAGKNNYVIKCAFPSGHRTEIHKQDEKFDRKESSRNYDKKANVVLKEKKMGYVGMI